MIRNWDLYYSEESCKIMVDMSVFPTSNMFSFSPALGGLVFYALLGDSTQVTLFQPFLYAKRYYERFALRVEIWRKML